MRRALITGGSGCLGRALVQKLIERNVAVRLFDLRPLAEDRVESVIGDITDEEKIATAMRDVDVVFNLAALQPASRAGGQFWRVNVGGTQTVLRAAAEAGVEHVVHLSSSIVYGVPRGRPLRESDALRPIGEYGRSKVEAEERCAQARSQRMSVSIIRPRVIMGPGRLGLFYILFEWIRRGKRTYMIGSGRNRFQMVYSLDLAEATILAAERRINEVLNVGSDDVPRVEELLGGLIRHAGTAARLQSLPAAPARVALRIMDRLGMGPLSAEHYLFADKDFVLDTSRAKALLDWRPSRGDLAAMQSAYDFFIAEGAAPTGFQPDKPPLGLLRVLRFFS
jgi:nucleoside-diphosphate-sugar epimerase